MAEGGILKTNDDKIFLKYCDDLFKKSEGTTPITIEFYGAKRDDSYSKFREIIVKHYGEENFEHKGENGINGYQCKSKEENVTITLYLGKFKLFIQGGGYEQWFNGNGTFDHLVKQLYNEMIQPRYQLATPKENLAELTTYKTHAVTGENKKPLVSEEEFYNCFAIPNVYGTHYLPWPRSTILLYKYSSNATTNYWEIPEDTWKRIDNILYGQHAELIMINDLKNIQEYLTIQPDDNEGSYKAILSVEVILSYSPCGECSQELCLLKEKMDEKLKQSKKRNKDPGTVLGKLSTLSLSPEIEEAEKVKFKITFSNFYKHLEQIFSTGKQNIEGLKNLLKSDIKLDIFSDENWDYFFNAAGLVTERQKRERDDRKILQYLEGLVTSERILAIEQDLRENDLL